MKKTTIVFMIIGMIVRWFMIKTSPTDTLSPSLWTLQEVFQCLDMWPLEHPILGVKVDHERLCLDLDADEKEESEAAFKAFLQSHSVLLSCMVQQDTPWHVCFHKSS